MKSKITIVLVSLLIWGCGGDGFETSSPVTIQLPSLSALVPSGVSKVRLQVTGADMDTITETITSSFGTSIEFNVDVPIGEDRTFTVTIADSRSAKMGYRGSATHDVTAEEETISIALDFVNMAIDATGDVASSSRSGAPDIQTVTIESNDNGTSSITTDDLYLVKIYFVDSVFSSGLDLYIEFDIDNDQTTGRTQTKIDSVKGAVTTHFSAGSEFYIQVTDVSVGIFNALIYDKDDNRVQADSSKLSASLDDTGKILTVQVIQAFTTEFGTIPSGGGLFNVLVGQLGSFIPQDIAFGAGNIRFDPDFDTSSF